MITYRKRLFFFVFFFFKEAILYNGHCFSFGYCTYVKKIEVKKGIVDLFLQCMLQLNGLFYSLLHTPLLVICSYASVN